ncbi:MAG: phosphodiester glycosidase family protein [Clostridia bacterium]|nr:phosphodiester glycosidase family protein [Clostridia bacterium]
MILTRSSKQKSLSWKKERRNNSKAGNISRFFIIVTLMMLLALLISCQKKKTEEPLSISVNPSPYPTISESENQDTGIIFLEKVITVNQRENHMFLLSVNPDTVRIVPYLSFNKIYGYETLSDMVKRENAFGAVTSGFFYLYGQPSGLVVNNGTVISAGTGRFNSLIVEKGKAYFEKIKTGIYAKTENNEILSIDVINAPFEDNIQSGAYNSYYGKTDRLDFEHTVIHIIGNNVMSVKKVFKEEEIPDEGYLLCFRTLPAYLMIKTGNLLTLVIEPSFEPGTNAYECSEMIVENGKNVAKDYDPWIGNLNQYDPRTCVGIDDDGNVVFIVIDGRQEGYSTGVTGKELADICIEMNLKDVAMLDGGASAEMIVDKTIVNKLSYKNEERPLAGGFLIFID